MYVQTDQPRSQDRLIISTAIPRITDEFNSAGDIGWYGTAYLLTNCAFQLVFGKLYTFFSVKATFLTSILLFEAGSALCGAAPNSIAFILGRAIAGLGSGGILSGVVRFSFPFSSLNTTLRQPFSSSSLLRLFQSIRSHHGTLDCRHCLRCSAAQAAQVPGFLWCRVWHLFGARPAGRRRLHHKRHLEMVLLPQPSLGRCGHGVDFLFAPSPRPSQHQDCIQRQAAAAQRPGPTCSPSRNRLPVPGPTMGWHHVYCEFRTWISFQHLFFPLPRASRADHI
jgi:hypothetical protein